MPNNYFSFKLFTIRQDKASFKVGTDGVLLGATANTEGAGRVLDVGSGTGLIAIMLAQRCNALITAIEPDRESYMQCMENVMHCPWKDRITVENTSIQEFRSSGTFDLIVSNPPYFSNSLKNPDPRKSASRHSDSLSDDDLLEYCSALLSVNGRLQVIMPYNEGKLLVTRAEKYNLFCNELISIKPLPSGETIRQIITLSHASTEITESSLTIGTGIRHHYTEEYISLTRDFYLKF